MDDWLWTWIQTQGLFLLENIGWWIVAVWVLLWIFLWRFARTILRLLQHIMTAWQLDALPFPRLARLLSSRFDNQRLTGLPLTLAAITFLAFALLLCGVVEDVVERDFIVRFDYWMATVMAEAHTKSIVSAFHSITMLGNANVVVPLWIIALITLSMFGNRFWALPLFISFIGSISMAALGKYGFARPRPTEALFVSHTASFPSGHSTLAMSFYAVLFYLWWRRTSSWNAQVWIVFAGVSFALLLGSSRIIIGVHYFSDVLAGLLLGGLWFILAISLYEWLNIKQYIQLSKDDLIIKVK